MHALSDGGYCSTVALSRTCTVRLHSTCLQANAGTQAPGLLGECRAGRLRGAKMSERQLTIPAGATCVEPRAYRGRLAEVDALVLPGTVTSIGADAFTGGCNISSITWQVLGRFCRCALLAPRLCLAVVSAVAAFVSESAVALALALAVPAVPVGVHGWTLTSDLVLPTADP